MKIIINRWNKGDLDRYYFNDENRNSIGYIQDRELKNGRGVTTYVGISEEWFASNYPKCYGAETETFKSNVWFAELIKLVGKTIEVGEMK